MLSSWQAALLTRLLLGVGALSELMNDAPQEHGSMLQMVRVPDPMASTETRALDRLAGSDTETTEATITRTATTTTLDNVVGVPVPPSSVKGSRFRGRGIAVAVNGADPVMLASAFALVRVVRRVFNSSMQIEFFHLGPEERFPTVAAARFVAEGGVKIVDLHEAALQAYNRWYDYDGLRDWRLPGAPTQPPVDPLTKPDQVDPNLRDSKSLEAALVLARRKRGWHVKPLTALVSSFEEVVLMDADALPLQPPERFFHHANMQPKAAQRGGSSQHATIRMVLFRDHVHCLTSVSAWLLSEIGLSVEDFCKAAADQEIDSSAVVMDKSDPAVWKALHIAEALNRRWCALTFLVSALMKAMSCDLRGFFHLLVLRHSSIFDQDHLLAGDKDTWLIAAMLSRGGLHSASAQSQSSNWRSPVSAHPPGFLVLATDGSQNYMHDACKPADVDSGSSCSGQESPSDQLLPEDGTVQTLSWHCHFDHQNLAPLYINSRQLHRMHAKLLRANALQPRLFYARGKGWSVPGPVVAADSANARAGGFGSNGTLPVAEFKRAVACYQGRLGNQEDLLAILNAVQKTNHGGAECWEPAGDRVRAALFAAAAAIVDIKAELDTFIPSASALGVAGVMESPNMLYVAGQRLESIGRLEEARSAYHRALESTAQLQLRARESSRVDRSRQIPANVKMKPLADANDTRATLLYHLAHAFLLEGGHVAEAIESATQAVDVSPQAGKGWQILGLAYEQLGTTDGLDAAARCYSRGTRVEPQLVANWYNLALLLAQAGRWEASLEAANGGLAVAPGHAAGWVARGNAQRQLTQPLAALESYQTATEVGPRHVAGWHNMGVVLHELGRVAASDAALGRARELKNQRP